MIAVTAKTMQEVDWQTIEGYGITGLQLMEAAGERTVEVISARFGEQADKSVLIMAGRGNNGGDGFVIARLLAQLGWNANVCVLSEKAHIHGDAAVNLDRIDAGSVSYCTSEQQLPSMIEDKIRHCSLIVDAMLGTGLNCPVSGIYEKAVQIINASKLPVVSVDIPSGINASSGAVMGSAVRADHTVTFAFAKLGHILFPGVDFTGVLTVADIGIPGEILEQTTGHEYLDAASVAPLLQPRKRQAHKGHYGHCLIIAGSRGMTGSAALSANSAVRSGAGLVSLAVPESLSSILEVKTTEAMTIPLDDARKGHLVPGSFSQIEAALMDKDALAVGPGMGRHPDTTGIIRRVVGSAPIPMVIDADGLNALAEDISILQGIRSAELILTPHPGEMARLTGSATPDDGIGRLAVAGEFAQKYGVYVVLKGARTVIAAPDGTTIINTSGNPGMASGGMGDILTGIITSLCGQGYNALDACRIGVFVHGFAGDMVAADKGETGITATDVMEMLPYAFKRLGSGISVL